MRLIQEGDLITSRALKEGLKWEGEGKQRIDDTSYHSYRYWEDISLTDYKHSINNNTVTKRYNKPWIQME